MGFEVGRLARREGFRLLEGIKYPIGRDFPRLKKSLFAAGDKPKRIIKINYSVNVEGLENEGIKFPKITSANTKN